MSEDELSFRAVPRGGCPLCGGWTHERSVDRSSESCLRDTSAPGLQFSPSKSSPCAEARRQGSLLLPTTTASGLFSRSRRHTVVQTIISVRSGENDSAMRTRT